MACVDEGPDTKYCEKNTLELELKQEKENWMRQACQERYLPVLIKIARKLGQKCPYNPERLV
jgi:hypothetical protein